METYEKQMKEIETIKERSIVITLSDADMERIFDKAGSGGLTVPELLKNFIGDLVDGTYSNGSDERNYANEWFDRCYFGGCLDRTFSQYLIESNQLDELVDLWNELQEAKGDLANALENPDSCDEEDIGAIEEDISFVSEKIDDIFSDYKSGRRNYNSTLEQEMGKVLEWYGMKAAWLALSHKTTTGHDDPLHTLTECSLSEKLEIAKARSKELQEHTPNQHQNEMGR